MQIRDIAAMPTEISRADAERFIAEGCKGMHESLTRSFHIVRKVEELLNAGCPSSVILEIISFLSWQKDA